MVALIKLNTWEEMEKLWNQIEIYGFQCNLSHKYLYKCQICNEIGDLEKRCRTIKTERVKLNLIQEQIQKTEKEFSIGTVAYHCKIQLAEQCLIT